MADFYKPRELSENCTLGEQIRYYRKVKGLTQLEVGQALGVSKECIRHVENDEVKLFKTELIKKILFYLEAQDKIQYNDDYIEFIIKNPIAQINEYRKKEGITIYELSLRIETGYSVVKRWISGKNTISRKKYEILKNLIYSN